MKQIKTRIIMFIGFLIIVLITVYLIGVNSFISKEQKQMNDEVSYLVEYAKNILELKVSYEETENTPFERYNDIYRYLNATATAKVKYSAQLMENKGVVNITYSQHVYEMNGILKKHIHGCEDAKGMWEVEKVDNKWKVISASDEP